MLFRSLSLSDGTFDEDAYIRRYERTAPFFLTFVYVARLHLCVLFGRTREAVAAAEQARAVAPGGTMWPVLVEFWGGMAAAAACDATTGTERDAHRQQLVAAHRELTQLAEHCADNFRCWALLDRKSTRLNSSHIQKSRMPSSA